VVFWVVKLEVGINLDPEDGRSMFLWNVAIHLQDCQMLLPRKPQSEHSLSWWPEKLCYNQINSTLHEFSWNDFSSSACQEINFLLLWNLQVHRNPLLDPIMSQLNVSPSCPVTL
jgi:hypothetical protein